MSYALGLYQNKNSDEPCKVTPHEEGATYRVGGSSDAELSITYNYSWFYYQFIDKKLGIRWLYGRRAEDCIERLEKAVKKLGTKKYMRLPEGADITNPKTEYYFDYWAPTPGNAGYALNILLQWAKEHPKGWFYGD